MRTKFSSEIMKMKGQLRDQRWMGDVKKKCQGRKVLRVVSTFE